jgi:hypothetical protein
MLSYPVEHCTDQAEDRHGDQIAGGETAQRLLQTADQLDTQRWVPGRRRPASPRPPRFRQ